jgi:hypothetical protein
MTVEELEKTCMIGGKREPNEEICLSPRKECGIKR